MRTLVTLLVAGLVLAGCEPPVADAPTTPEAPSVAVHALGDDVVPPRLSFVAPAEGATVSGTVMLSGLVSDDQGVVRVAIELSPAGCDGNACSYQVLETQAPEPFEQFQVEWDTRSAINGPRALRAKAYDRAGNASSPVILNVVVDNDRTPPQTALTAPASGAFLAGWVSLEASASDERQLAGVSFYVDGHLIETDTTAPYALAWDTSSVFNGGHTLHTVAFDGAGNRTTGASVTVETSNPDVTVYFDPVLKAPRCDAVRASCDSRSLLRGRGDTGGERNPPNTLGACPDGSIYRPEWNEAVERIRVIREDGTVLAPGKRVRIEVDVWVSQASFDTLNLYYAADATRPSWTQLTTLRPPAGTSNQSLVTLSAEYLLPVGSLQAVRAEFGYGEGFGTCTVRSPWVSVTDHDDLVFAVSQVPDTVPPRAAITSPANGATVSGQVPLSFVASDDFDVVTVELYDGQTRLMTVYPESFHFSMGWDTRNGPNGSRTLTARARDQAGNVGVSQPVTVTVDNDLTAPVVALTAPTAGARLTPGTVEVSASATDERGVISRVEFYVGSTWIGTDDTAPFSVPWSVGQVSQATPRTLTARAYDAAGNRGTSGSVGVTVEPELTPPSVALTAPSAGARLSGTVALSADATDASGVGQVEFLLDGVLLGSVASSPYGFTWDTRTAASGEHTLSARATDLHGNVATASVGVTVDNEGPVVALGAPAQQALLVGTVEVSATASDNLGVLKVEFYAGATLLGTDSSAPYTVGWDTTGVADGPHALTVKGFDGVGNTRTSAEVTVTVDNTAPTTALNAPAQNALVRGTVPVSATASDALGVAKVEFYAGTTLFGTDTSAPYAVSWDTTAAANGGVTLTTRAHDLAGNVTVSAGRTVTVDNSAPTVAITSPANGASLFLSATLQASAGDNRGVTQVVFHDGATVIGTDTTAPYSVSWSLLSVSKGTHTLTARAHDAAGNVTTSAPVSVKVN